MMKCTKGTLHPCRKCLACLINARRVWEARLMLESQCHGHSFFSTLTYKKEPSDGSLHKTHLSGAIDRLRKMALRRNKAVRYFGIGEYGDQRGRPHYHAAIFGLDKGDGELITAAWHGLRDEHHQAEAGFCHHGVLTPASAAYITAYATKFLGKDKAAVIAELGGRQPEFALMSLRPAIGMLAFEALVDALNSSAGAYYMSQTGDVPNSFMVGSRLMPLGRTIRDHLRVFFFGEKGQPKQAKEINERKFFAENMPFVPPDASPTLRKMAMAEFSQEVSDSQKLHFDTLMQRGRQIKARAMISNSKRKL